MSEERAEDTRLLTAVMADPLVVQARARLHLWSPRGGGQGTENAGIDLMHEDTAALVEAVVRAVERAAWRRRADGSICANPDCAPGAHVCEVGVERAAEEPRCTCGHKKNAPGETHYFGDGYGMRTFCTVDGCSCQRFDPEPVPSARPVEFCSNPWHRMTSVSGTDPCPACGSFAVFAPWPVPTHEVGGDDQQEARDTFLANPYYCGKCRRLNGCCAEHDLIKMLEGLTFPRGRAFDEANPIVEAYRKARAEVLADERASVDARLAALTRVEIIDEHGRAYSRCDCNVTMIDIQDSGRTLKVFVSPSPAETPTGGAAS